MKRGMQVRIKENEVPHREGPMAGKLGTPRKKAIDITATSPMASDIIEPLKRAMNNITSINPKVTIGFILASSP